MKNCFFANEGKPSTKWLVNVKDGPEKRGTDNNNNNYCHYYYSQAKKTLNTRIIYGMLLCYKEKANKV